MQAEGQLRTARSGVGEGRGKGGRGRLHRAGSRHKAHQARAGPFVEVYAAARGGIGRYQQHNLVQASIGLAAGRVHEVKAQRFPGVGGRGSGGVFGVAAGWVVGGSGHGRVLQRNLEDSVGGGAEHLHRHVQGVVAEVGDVGQGRAAGVHHQHVVLVGRAGVAGHAGAVVGSARGRVQGIHFQAARRLVGDVLNGAGAVVVIVELAHGLRRGGAGNQLGALNVVEVVGAGIVGVRRHLKQQLVDIRGQHRRVEIAAAGRAGREGQGFPGVGHRGHGRKLSAEFTGGVVAGVQSAVLQHHSYRYARCRAAKQYADALGAARGVGGHVGHAGVVGFHHEHRVLRAAGPHVSGAGGAAVHGITAGVGRVLGKGAFHYRVRHEARILKIVVQRLGCRLGIGTGGQQRGRAQYAGKSFHGNGGWEWWDE